MSKIYTSIMDLYNEIVECKIIDLIPHAVGIAPNLLAALNDPRPGLYMPGSIQPIFEKGEVYTLIQKRGVIQITFDDIMKDFINDKRLPGGDFFHEKMKFRLRRSQYERVKPYFITNPNIPVKGCEVAIATVVGYLNTLSPHTNVAAYNYQLPLLVKEESHYLLDQESYEIAFDELFLEVRDFVGRDSWNLYFYRVLGTTLIIEKGLDFRIVDWHMSQIKNSDGYDHDLGGISESFIPIELKR